MSWFLLALGVYCGGCWLAGSIIAYRDWQVRHYPLGLYVVSVLIYPVTVWVWRE